MQDFGTRLKLHRIARRRLQREVAQRADLSPSALSDFENNWRQPTTKQLDRICEALGVRREELLKAVDLNEVGSNR